VLGLAGGRYRIRERGYTYKTGEVTGSAHFTSESEQNPSWLAKRVLKRMHYTCGAYARRLPHGYYRGLSRLLTHDERSPLHSWAYRHILSSRVKTETAVPKAIMPRRRLVIVLAALAAGLGGNKGEAPHLDASVTNRDALAQAGIKLLGSTSAGEQRVGVAYFERALADDATPQPYTVDEEQGRILAMWTGRWYQISRGAVDEGFLRHFGRLGRRRRGRGRLRGAHRLHRPRRREARRY